jgi:hypothetical protein
MKVQRLSGTRVERRDNEWLSINDKAGMAQKSFVEDGMNLRDIVNSTLG